MNTPARRVAEVAGAFLKLGLGSFGGPIAHLGYFHREFVERRCWLDDEHFARLLGLCQFLPGPASSQLGFVLGLLRAGWPGAFAAFLAFTLPSALLLFAFASASERLSGPWGGAVIHGLKLLAVAVVAQAALAMARTLTPDRPRRLMALLAAAFVLAWGGAWMQVLLVTGGALVGSILLRSVSAAQGEAFDLPYGRRTGASLLLAFAALLAVALFLAPGMALPAQVAGGFYQAGALVFGGGHVVLPLLQETVVAPGWVDEDSFLAGYGAAQAVPGPMFAVAAFLGERVSGDAGGPTGAAVALIAIFLPGLLLVAGALPFWRALAARRSAARMMAGANAVVVGLLAAALYDPVWTGTIRHPVDVLVVLVAFALLAVARVSAAWVAIACVAAALGIAAYAAGVGPPTPALP
jgi:chromate transporter